MLGTDMHRVVVFTDLDGTLLDSATYSFKAAEEALNFLRSHHIPVVLASSKTRAEIELIRNKLDLPHSFIVENGGGLYIPDGLFTIPLRGATLRDSYQVIEFGTPYPMLRAALRAIEQIVEHRLRGFGDMPAEEIAERTGLGLAEAILAKQREYDEPFVIEGPATLITKVERLVTARGLHCTRGGRFCHLTGNTDKGRACQFLIDCYRRQYGGGDDLSTVAIGDSLNDLPMLAVVDRPILVEQPDGSYHPDVSLPNLTRAPGVGPIGWNQAILDLMSQFYSSN
ncbi:MAG: HAD-IIB family hydrolase [Nitrospiraceae bacterium]